LEDLKKDFVVMAMPAKGINEAGSVDKVRKHLEIIKRHNPICMGGQRVGNSCLISVDEVIANAKSSSSTYNGVFHDRETVTEILREELKEDVGLSIIVSGVYDEVKKIGEELGLKPHTVNFSLGVWGKKEKLPEPEVLEIITLCGHGLISQHLVRCYFDKVAKGYSAQKAAKEICSFCYCSIMNLERVAEILERGFSTQKEQ
jgi:hypothetical protein